MVAAPRPRSRILSTGLLLSGLTVAAFHSGFPLGCAITPGARVEKLPVEMPLPSGLPDELVLSRSPSLDGLTVSDALVGATSTSTVRGRRARIQRGTSLEILFERPGEAPAVIEGAFVGLERSRGWLLLTQDGDTLEYVDVEQVRELTVRGEAPSGYIGRGVLVGGLSTAVLSAATGAVLVASMDDDVSQAIAGICSATIGGGASLVALGVGAAVGNAQAQDARPRYPHPIAPGAWSIDPEPPAAPPAPPPPRRPIEPQADWPDLLPSQYAPSPSVPPTPPAALEPAPAPSTPPTVLEPAPAASPTPSPTASASPTASPSPSASASPSAVPLSPGDEPGQPRLP
jgi:hypothetical protein